MPVARGYYEEARMEETKEVDHLIFVVHGIGQKYDTERIVRNTDG